MRHVVLPSEESHPLEFYLAMEEYLAQAVSEDIFFLWQTSPTVIFGRNQSAEAEVNLPWCREHGVHVVQRKSGGGCVYSDGGNVMLSYITPRTNVEEVFGDYLNMICEALKALGLEAASTQHNDILVAGSKVSGSAYFVLPHSSIVHGTMLYDSDFSALEKAITPSKEKLSKHGVQSVRARVANLTSLGLTLPLEQFKSYLIGRFCDEEFTLTPSDEEAIDEISKTYRVVVE